MYHGQHKDRSNLKFFTDATLSEVQDWARAGITREEIMDGYSLAWEDLPQADQDAFEEHYRYGRIQGIKQMSDALFLQARGKQGTPAALAFLARFSKEWQGEINPDGKQTFNFTMNV
jgi:hypothetical protein